MGEEGLRKIGKEKGGHNRKHKQSIVPQREFRTAPAERSNPRDYQTTANASRQELLKLERIPGQVENPCAIGTGALGGDPAVFH